MTSKTFRIENTTSGLILGDYAAETAAAALDAMARDAGYADQAEALSVTGGDGSDLKVTEISFAPGDRVEGGEPGTEDYDTGTVLDLPDDTTPAYAINVRAGNVWVGWDTGVATWAKPSDLRSID